MRPALLLLLASPAVLAADLDTFPLRVLDSGPVSNHYCGLYCVYQAGQLTGRTVPLNGLFKPERLSGKYGSTPGDLAAACAEFGIPQFSIINAGYVDVCLLGEPVIALIRSSPDVREPNHWIMVLEARPGRARIFEPASGVHEVSEAELQVLWGGPAIVVPASGDAETTVRGVWLAGKIALGALLLALPIALMHGLARLGVPPAAGLLLAMLIVAVLLSGLHPAGIARNWGLVAARHHVLDPAPARLIEPSEAVSRAGELQFVDVRTQPQFDYQHLPGAMNVPIDGPYWSNLRRLERLPADAPLVLYCNIDCGWSEAMARSSLFHRFADVRVLNGGRDEFIRAGGQVIGAQPDK